MSKPEDNLSWQLQAAGIAHEREFRFAKPRRYRADVFIAPNLLVEVEGGQYVMGRHQRPEGFAKDCEKYNLATLLGFRLLRFTTTMVNEGIALATIEQALAKCGEVDNG